MVHTTPLRPPFVLDLPLELLGAILVLLCAPDLLACSAACRAFNALIHDAPELQYTLELHASDLADNPLCTLPARARLAELHRRRRAWRALAFAAPRTAALPGACTAYELVGGVFAQMGDAHALAARWLYDGGALERKALDVPARDLALDPSVDLIALVELPPGNPPTVHVHLRTLSTNTRHPAARFGRLTHRTGGRVDSAVVQLHGTSLAFFWAAYDAPGLVIWNWQTGQKLVERIGPLEPGDGWSFDLLSPTAYVLASRGGRGALVVYAFDDTGRARCVARLGLPALRPGVRLAHVAVHSGAAVAHEDAHEPFGPAPGTGVHAVSLEYAGASGVRTRFALYVRARTLLRAAGDAEWDAWGPPATRVMLQPAEWGWMRYVHGARVALPPRGVQDGPAPEQLLTVLDFGVRPARWAGGGAPLFGPSVEDAGGAVFARPVRSALPCAIVERQEKAWRYAAFMLDGRGLVGLRRAPVEGDVRELDVFVV